jgi:EAL domain-containing protein (putative c-di-GMP-specific phosphodiesterase class I)
LHGHPHLLKAGRESRLQPRPVANGAPLALINRVRSRPSWRAGEHLRRDLDVERAPSAHAAKVASFAHGVVLEVTERAALEQVPGLIPAVLRLRELGFRIALDDLGAGYAGLSSFALLEPEIVKVDMSLVQGIHRSPTKQKLFRSFSGLCKDLKTEIIAEGVEVAEERDCLNDLGGDLYQGYLFARPDRGFPQPAF